jgi:hypothetical protein
MMHGQKNIRCLMHNAVCTRTIRRSSAAPPLALLLNGFMSNVTSYVMKACVSEPRSGIRIFFPSFHPKSFSGITTFVYSRMPSSGAVIGRCAASVCVQTFFLLSAAFLAFYVKVSQKDSYIN